MSTDLALINPTVESLLANLDRGRAALLAASEDYQRLDLRDSARKAQVAAEILNRRDISVQYSILIADAERAIAFANPAAQGERSDLATSPAGGTSSVPKTTLARIRRVGDLPDDEYEKMKHEAMVKQEPLTQKALIAAARVHTKSVARETRLAEARAVEWTLQDVSVVTSSIADLMHTIPADSIDVICTDPPYPYDYIDCWSELSAFAAHALKPGGTLIAMSGQLHFPEVFRRLSEHLTYRWLGAYTLQNGRLPVHPARISSSVKPLLIFSKPGPVPAVGYATDLYGSKLAYVAEAKESHEWGQTWQSIRDIITEFTPPGGYVYDPFCGGGSTLVAAIDAGFLCGGSDIDSDAVAMSRQHIVNYVCKEDADG